jgi:hypothetical protein
MHPNKMIDGNYYRGKNGKIRRFISSEFVLYKGDVATYYAIPKGEKREIMLDSFARWAVEDLGPEWRWNTINEALTKLKITKEPLTDLEHAVLKQKDFY